MRILLLVNKVPYPPTDGGAYATLNMALGLSNAGANVSILAMSTPKHSTTAKDFPKWITSRIDVETVFVDTAINPLRALKNFVFSSIPYNAERFISLEFENALKVVLKSRKFDVIQLEGLYIEPYIKTIRHYHKGPIAFRAHNVEWELWARNASIQTNPLRRLYFRHLSGRIKKMEKDILGEVDALVPISSRDAEGLIEMGFAGRVMVTPTGFDFSENHQGNDSFEYPSIFHIGGLDWLPNQEGILWFLKECWPLVIAKLPEVKFYIAGRKAPQAFQQKIQRYPNLIFCGEVTSSVEFIRSKALMVVPLLSGSGMRIKIVEGMALGKAIVSTSVGAEGVDAVHDTHLAIANTPVEMANSIINLLSSKQKILQMGSNAQKFVKQQLDNDIITKRLFLFYKDLLADFNH